jgi:nitroimidazol reductase NimA-like FMN-containing flavoprotein (pyridoxamine 5'-phosphate oxidase superfamily)
MSDPVPPELEELLTGDPLVAYLATSHEDRPHVAPLWFRYETGTVEVMTTGRKLANLRRNPKASLAVQAGPSTDPDWTATLRGTAHVVDDEAEARAANRWINRRYGASEDAWSGNTLVRIEVGSATFRRY